MPHRNIFPAYLYSSEICLEYSTPLYSQIDADKKRFNKVIAEYLLAKTAIDASSVKKTVTVALKLLLGSDVIMSSTAAAIPIIKVQLSPPHAPQPTSSKTSPSYDKKHPCAKKEASETDFSSHKKTKEKPTLMVKAKKDNRKKKKVIKKAIDKTISVRSAKKGKDVVWTDEQLQEEAEACVASCTLSQHCRYH